MSLNEYDHWKTTTSTPCNWLTYFFTVGASQNWIGGSAISWIHQHVVQHHIHTNDTGKDPDIAGSVYLRLNPSQPLLNNYLFQHFYFFILLCFYGFSIVVQSLGKQEFMLNFCVCNQKSPLKQKMLSTVSTIRQCHQCWKITESSKFSPLLCSCFVGSFFRFGKPILLLSCCLFRPCTSFADITSPSSSH